MDNKVMLDGLLRKIEQYTPESFKAFQDWFLQHPNFDVNERDQNGYTPLLYAASIAEDDNRPVELLIAKGADVNHRGADGKTALRLAKFNGNTKIYTFLEKAGAKDPEIEMLRLFRLDPTKRYTVLDVLRSATYLETLDGDAKTKVNRFYEYLRRNADERVWLVLTCGALFALDNEYQGRGLEVFMTPFNSVASLTGKEKHTVTRGLFYNNKNAMLISNLDQFTDGAGTLVHELTHKIRRTLPQKQMQKLLQKTLETKFSLPQKEITPGLAYIENDVIDRIEYSKVYDRVAVKLEEYIADVPKIILKSNGGSIKRDKKANALIAITPLLQFFDQEMAPQMLQFIKAHSKSKQLLLPEVLYRRLKTQPTSSIRHREIENKAVYTAIEEANLEQMKHQIEKGLKINQTSQEMGYLPYAILYGSYHIAKDLILKGADVNQPLDNGFTPLHLAAFSSQRTWDNRCKLIQLTNSTDLVRHMVEKGAGINAPTKDGMTPLMVAATKSNAESIVDFLLEKGANPNLKDHWGNTAREYAFRYGNEIIGNTIAQKQYEFVMPQDKRLIEAAKNNSLDTVKMLLHKQADINVRDEKGYSPLFYAAKNNNLIMLQYLIDHGANINAKENRGRTLLMEAGKEGWNEAAKIIISIGALTHEKDFLGKTALMHSAAMGNEELLQRLLQKEELIEQVDKKLKTPLLHAIELNQTQTAKQLVRAGANVNHVDNFGMSALSIAALKNNTEICKIILKRGARIDQKDNWNNQPMKYAVDKGNMELVHLFYRYGADLHIKTGTGKTYEQLAKEAGHIKVSQFLNSVKHDKIPRALKSGEDMYLMRERMEKLKTRDKNDLSFQLG